MKHLVATILSFAVLLSIAIVPAQAKSITANTVEIVKRNSYGDGRSYDAYPDRKSANAHPIAFYVDPAEFRARAQAERTYRRRNHRRKA